MNLGFEHKFRVAGSTKNAVKFRVDVVNVFDESYQIRSGTGVGVEAGKPRLTSRSTLPTRCSSADRMYVSGRPDSKISRIVLAARLSTGPGVAECSITGLSIVFSSAILGDSFYYGRAARRIRLRSFERRI